MYLILDFNNSLPIFISCYVDDFGVIFHTVVDQSVAQHELEIPSHEQVTQPGVDEIPSVEKTVLFRAVHHLAERTIVVLPFLHRETKQHDRYHTVRIESK